jgi:hypothetical protein
MAIETISVSLTFTTENTLVLRQFIISLQQVYKTLVYTKTETIQEDYDISDEENFA